MPPQKYWMSGPCLAAAAAWKPGMRPSVVCRTVSIVTFECSFSYAATVSFSQPLAPGASWSPHHHMTRCTGPVGKAVSEAVPDASVAALPRDLDAAELHPAASAAMHSRARTVESLFIDCSGR